MRYTTIPNDRTKWEFIYCNKTGTATAEDIANMFCGYSGMFHTNDHTPEDCMPIRNDTGMFFTENIDGCFSIWQVGGLASDCLGQTIPHVYKVRRIAYAYVPNEPEIKIWRKE